MSLPACLRRPSVAGLLALVLSVGHARADDPDPIPCPLWPPPISLLLYRTDGGTEVRSGPLDGLTVQPLDGYPRLHIGGRRAADLYLRDSRNRKASGVRPYRVTIETELLPWEGARLFVSADPAGIDTRDGLHEAHASIRYERAIRLTGGLLRVPLGVEHGIPEGRLPHLSYGFAAQLSGRSDLAVRLDGELLRGLLSYDATFAFGEGFDLQGQRRGDPQLSVRLMSYPFRAVDLAVAPFGEPIPLISGLFVSLASAYQWGYEAHVDVMHPYRGNLFDAPRVTGDSGRLWHGGIGWDLGPVRYTHEAVRAGIFDLDLPDGRERHYEGQITAWQASLSVMLTGEPYDSRPMRQDEPRPDFPRRPLFGAPEGCQTGFGALELAVRYMNGDIDRQFFEDGLTTYEVSSQEFRVFTAALHWYPARSLRLGAEVARTLADQGPRLFRNHERDTSVALRFDWAF